MNQRPTIKPIETCYSGCRFRSRLEARWAVFFDKLGISWQYELEGFDLGNGIWYLPDFYLPDHDCYVEIKSSLENISRTEWEKMFRLVDAHNLLLAAGVPGTNDLYLLPPGKGGCSSEDLLEHLNEYHSTEPEEFLEDYKEIPSFAKFFSDGYAWLHACFHPVISFPFERDYPPIWTWGIALHQHCHGRRHQFERAIEGAKSARFEFGEKGEQS